MAGEVRLMLMLAAAAAAVVGFSPARGQCRLCDKPTTALNSSGRGDDLELQIETSLDFDRLVLASAGTGAAVIRPDGSSAAQGALADVSSRAMVGTAIVHGAAGRAVRVDLPSRIELYSISGGRITLDQVVSDLPSAPHLDSVGNLTFRFGGRLTVTGDSDGAYRGEMPITVEYQ